MNFERKQKGRNEKIQKRKKRRKKWKMMKEESLQKARIKK